MIDHSRPTSALGQHRRVLTKGSSAIGPGEGPRLLLVLGVISTNPGPGGEGRRRGSPRRERSHHQQLENKLPALDVSSPSNAARPGAGQGTRADGAALCHVKEPSCTLPRPWVCRATLLPTATSPCCRSITRAQVPQLLVPGPPAWPQESQKGGPSE